jgi:hypothetical protein
MLMLERNVLADVVTDAGVHEMEARMLRCNKANREHDVANLALTEKKV